MQILIVDPRLADPVPGLRLQEIFKDISEYLVADDLLDQIVVVLLMLEQGIISANCLSDQFPLEHVHFLRLQKRDKRLAEVFRNILGISQLVFLTLFRQPSSSHFLENVNLFAISFIFGVVLVAVISGDGVLGLPGQLFGLMNDIAFRYVERVRVLNSVDPVLVDDLRDFLDSIAVHFAKMVLDLELRGGVLLQQRKMEIVLILPVNAVEVELLLSQNALGEDALLPHHLELIGGVHFYILIMQFMKNNQESNQKTAALVLPSAALEIRSQVETLIFHTVNNILSSKFTKIALEKGEIIFQLKTLQELP